MVRRSRRQEKSLQRDLAADLRHRQIYRGGCYQPLSDTDRDSIIESAFTILAKIGMAGAPDWLRQCLLDKGCKLREDGRILFDRGLVESALNSAAKNVTLPGFNSDQGIDIGGGNVHIGTGGAAVQILEANSGIYRDSTLTDLYTMMRIVDKCPNIHYGIRPLIARDLDNAFELDINTAYACVRGTSKPIGVSFDSSAHIEPVVNLFDLALGTEGGFRHQPFCMAVIVHVVPPLRYVEEGVESIREAMKHGLPLQICSAGQAGATSPASLAGALAQGLAESLAGLMVVDAISPGYPCIFAFMPFISDLRTGAMTGGGGESAVANAAAAQILLALELPSTVSAGMTDAKIIDAQAGYEKGYTVALAAQAGADMINLSVGMLGSIMVASPEALVIDDEMCGAILRTVRGIEVDDRMLDLDTIEHVVTGAGHYLGETQTLNLMKTEYVYPQLSDRQSVDDWTKTGSSSMLARAQDHIKNLLDGDNANHFSTKADEQIRQHFPIKLLSE